jgi:cell division protein FtsI (penicillin-binding protein 3)
VSAGNIALQNVYEPGSVNKVITAAAALEEGVSTPDQLWTVPYSIQVADHLFKEHDWHPTEEWSLTRIMRESSNVGTIKLGQALGPETLYRYLSAFGLGQATGLGFPFESKGLLPPPDRWYGAAKGSIPLGHGVSVTAVQMLGAYNAIANRGVLVAPRLLAATIGPDGRSTDAPASPARRVVSERTASQLTAMLQQVVEDGTGTKAAVPGYHVAGKTGTARKPQPNGTYYDAAGRIQYVSTFAGFVPAEAPRLSVIAVIDQPSNGFYAGEVAAPLFSRVAAAALRELRIPPSTATPPAR